MDENVGKVKVSVIITSYNIAAYIDEAVASVLAQETDFPFEVICGDDGSDDGTWEKLRDWQAREPERIRTVRQPREAGKRYNGPTRASMNRLDLLGYVKGEYFLFLDGDDLFCDVHKLQKQVDVLEDPANADCVFCAHRIDWYYGENDARNTVPGNPYWMTRTYKTTAKQCWRNCYYHPDSILCRSRVIEKIPVSVRPRYFNDVMITYCMLQCGNAYYLSDLMAHYRQTGSGIWSGSHEGANQFRAMMTAEQVVQLNPRFRHVSGLRYRATMRYWMKNGGRVDEKELSPYLEYAKEDGLPHTLQWTDYCHQPFAARLRMRMIYGWYTMCLTVEKLGHIGRLLKK